MSQQNLLVVCSMNVCRSAYAAARLGLLTASRPYEIVSRGTDARAGMELCEHAAARLCTAGVSHQAHRAAQLTADDIRGAGLIITATTAHRSQVVRLVPEARMRVFTITEAAALVSAALAREPRAFGGVKVLRDVAPALGRLRGRVHPPAPSRSVFARASAAHGWDLIDRHGGNSRQHRILFDDIDAGLRGLIRALVLLS